MLQIQYAPDAGCKDSDIRHTHRQFRVFHRTANLIFLLGRSCPAAAAGSIALIMGLMPKCVWHAVHLTGQDWPMNICQPDQCRSVRGPGVRLSGRMQSGIVKAVRLLMQLVISFAIAVFLFTAVNSGSRWFRESTPWSKNLPDGVLKLRYHALASRFAGKGQPEPVLMTSDQAFKVLVWAVFSRAGFISLLSELTVFALLAALCAPEQLCYRCHSYTWPEILARGVRRREGPNCHC